MYGIETCSHQLKVYCVCSQDKSCICKNIDVFLCRLNKEIDKSSSVINKLQKKLKMLQGNVRQRTSSGSSDNLPPRPPVSVGDASLHSATGHFIQNSHRRTSTQSVERPRNVSGDSSDLSPYSRMYTRSPAPSEDPRNISSSNSVLDENRDPFRSSLPHGDGTVSKPYSPKKEDLQDRTDSLRAQPRRYTSWYEQNLSHSVGSDHQRNESLYSASAVSPPRHVRASGSALGEDTQDGMPHVPHTDSANIHFTPPKVDAHNSSTSQIGQQMSPFASPSRQVRTESQESPHRHLDKLDFDLAEHLRENRELREKLQESEELNRRLMEQLEKHVNSNQGTVEGIISKHHIQYEI